MESDRGSKEEDSVLKDAMQNSGFTTVPIKELYNTLDKMEHYMMAKTGLNRSELSFYLDKLKTLVGEEEAVALKLEDIVSWIKAFRS
jgi:hypothetical protein